MPSVQTEALHHIIVTISTDDLVQTGIGGRKFSIVHLVDPCFILFSCVKIIRTAEVIFSTRTIHRREFDFTFAPPSIVVYTPCQVGTHILTLTADTIHKGTHAIFYPVGPSKLSMKISGVIWHFG